MSRVSSSYVEPSTAPTEDVAGAVNGAAWQYSFKTSARPCLITNTHASVAVFVNVNKAADPSATSFDFRIPAMTAANVDTLVDVSMGGQLAVKNLRVFVPTGGAIANVIVRGWPIGGA